MTTKIVKTPKYSSNASTSKWRVVGNDSDEGSGFILSGLGEGKPKPTPEESNRPPEEKPSKKDK